MVLFDFLFYYLTMWFSTAITKQFRTPAEQACYALGIVCFIYIFGAISLIEHSITKSFKSYISDWAYILIGLGLMQLFQYIYITRGRYDLIKNGQNMNVRFNITDKKGIFISLSFGVGSLLFFIISVFIIHL